MKYYQWGVKTKKLMLHNFWIMTVYHFWKILNIWSKKIM
jgi:hypothetical protein